MPSLELKIPPVGLTLLAAVAMYVLALGIPAAAFDLPGAIFVAIGCAFAGIAFAVPGVWAFRRTDTTVNPFTPEKSSALVVDGIYRYTRNPMYVGLALLLVAWAAILGNAFSAVVIPAYIVYMTQFQIRPEERALLATFGSEYRAYMDSVRRWL